MEPAIYLFFNGTCQEAMTLYADVLGGNIGLLVRNSDAPNAESRMPGGDDMIMHMNMTLGRATVMASDCPEGMYSVPQGFRVSIEAASREEFDRIYNALSTDAQSVDMAPAEAFWAERFSMFKDRYGTPWMLSFTGNKGAA